ncbi:MAG: hypothetical protein BWY82_01928 [Verrucomicrobia bacterium ADurb.Bin474]|nr:MAG: hypothetical protein BWY82_01928 [Verrucomicrobia bacterium ADurb.Bin474]
MAIKHLMPIKVGREQLLGQLRLNVPIEKPRKGGGLDLDYRIQIGKPQGSDPFHFDGQVLFGHDFLQPFVEEHCSCRDASRVESNPDVGRRALSGVGAFDELLAIDFHVGFPTGAV